MKLADKRIKRRDHHPRRIMDCDDGVFANVAFIKMNKTRAPHMTTNEISASITIKNLPKFV